MARKQHNRQYDIVVFGATGYTGKYTAQYITTHLPTHLKWAVAGRSESKLQQLINDIKPLNPDRTQPAIEIANLSDADLSSLAKKTYILISTVGPYSRLGEHAFKACAENGTHYLDVTGEVPWVSKMIQKYESTAKSSGALMFPQIGIESAPADLVTFSLASTLRSQVGAKTGDVTVSIHKLSSSPSGGTLSTVFTIADVFSVGELQAAYKPYALSPVPNPTPGPARSLLSRLTGLITVPELGLLTSSVASTTDAALVQRSWGLLSTLPGKKAEAYGNKFSFREFMKPRNWLTGIGIHIGLVFLQLIIVAPLLRNILSKKVVQPGFGPDPETASRDEIEYRGIATAEGDAKKQAACKAWFNGSAYYLTGILLAEAASTLLEEEDLGLPEGGIYTPACLGQPLIDRLGRAGFHFETNLLVN
ncbi:Saccharopine dehydrogenase-like oxidoreductase [Podospora australis]|uniref:Saccharopine dehydrogenase-like oxidoreductase n=1 Tax=Podospora australis TaxID=1536484 RepID=A0AAN7AKK0_9PEZI|nr:Saccharopine dehydrogenase-like oxidoreductase [Podospora australis]